MPFGLRNRVGPKNRVLDVDGGQHLSMRKGNYEGEGAAHCKAYEYSVVRSDTYTISLPHLKAATTKNKRKN